MKIRSYARLMVLGWKLSKANWQIKKYHWVENESEIERLFNHRKALSKSLLRRLGFKLHISGNLPEKQVIFVGNHRSYIDPIITTSLNNCVAVAKQEMQSWPLIGPYSDKCGTLFVKRENPDSRKEVLLKMMRVLRNGHSLLIYPEGTSHDQDKTLPFQLSIFSIAAKLNIPVIPLTTEYRNRNMSFVDDDTFVKHFIKNFNIRKNDVYVHFGEPVTDHSPEESRDMTQKMIDNQLNKFQSSIGH